jgi:C1A family cysteine protease
MPESYSTKSNLFGVRDQGQIGSCVSQACATTKDYQERVDAASKVASRLSALFIYDRRKDLEVEGMETRDAFDILLKLGTPLESDYPNRTDSQTPKAEITQEILDSAKKYAIHGYARIKTVDEAKQAIMKNGPIVIVIPVYNYDAQLWEKISGDTLLGYHAVALIGWDKDGFILRNSWSESWANRGETIFPYGDFPTIVEAWTLVDEDSSKILKKMNIFQKILDFIWSKIVAIFHR